MRFPIEHIGLGGQVRLVSQIWPSGQELGSQPQGPGSIPFSPYIWDPGGILVGSEILVGSLWDPTSVLLGQRNPPGVIFRLKPVLEMENKVFGEI